MSPTRAVVLLSLCLLSAAYGADVVVWPQPRSLSLGETTLSVAERHLFDFAVQPTLDGVLPRAQTTLLAAVDRCRDLVFSTLPDPWETPMDAVAGELIGLEIVVRSSDENLTTETDESYRLVVDEGYGKLEAETVYGAMWGLETFAQLVQVGMVVEGAPILVEDAPRFKWRGILLDTSRHFISVGMMKRLIDGMSYTKMNVLHWHIVDTDAFPMEIISFPRLHEAGAYARAAVYSQETIQDIVEYGRMRGVRVYLEIDSPGHAYSWGLGYPELTVDCPSYSDVIHNVPLDPSKDFTYEVVNAVIQETASLQADEFIHIGGDEVVYACWNESREVIEWALDMGFDDFAQVENHYIRKVVDMVRGSGRRSIVWQEAFDNCYDTCPTIGLDTIVHVWIHRESMQTALEAGHDVVLSQGWYLDVLQPGESHYRFQEVWRDFYSNEPFEGLDGLSPEILDKVLGGEAAMWTEQVDDSNLESRIWPRSLAVAERLWSPREVDDIEKAKSRLSSFRCTMWRRGIAAGPVDWPDYCPTVFYP